MARTLLGALVLPAALLAPGAGAETARGTDTANPFRGNGMWIWYVGQSSGGDYGRIARKARNHRIRVIYVKSSDGSSAWSQFTPGLVSFMHSRGIRVCAWQYVYGTYPVKEALRGAEAVAKGADCLVVDAEAEYEGDYAPADRYIDALRPRIGREFPLGFTGFPYVDFHPSFPYSVFLGRRGAQYNLPQLYWHTIGTTVDNGFLHTFTHNRIYTRPQLPLGQTYLDPPVRQVRRFRRLAKSYGFEGVSWWSWQETRRREWRSLGRPAPALSDFSRPGRSFPILQKGSAGDMVVWAQEHLRGAGRHVPVTGYFGRRTRRAVRRFQAEVGLRVTGVIRARTWRRLLDERPVSVDWSSRKRGKAVGAVPASAALPALAYELPSEGAGAWEDGFAAP